MSASHPRYLWWNGKRVAWEGATVHVTQLGWATVPAIFEGIMSYWNDAEEELFVFRLDAHLQRFLRSQKMMRMARDYSVAQLTEAIADLLRANECRQDTYVYPLAFLGTWVSLALFIRAYKLHRSGSAEEKGDPPPPPLPGRDEEQLGEAHKSVINPFAVKAGDDSKDRAQGKRQRSR